MPDTKEDTQLQPVVSTPFFRSPEMQKLLGEYGITQESITAPTPPTVAKANWDQLMSEHWTVRDETDNVITCRAHTGPLMFLHAGEPIAGDKFDAYAGYIIYTVAHPKRGKVIVTHGVPKDEHGNPTKSDVMRHLETLAPGALFMVAEFPTNAGYRVFRCIPVQAPVD